MKSKNTQPSPGQEALFSRYLVDPSSNNTPGISVRLADRANHLSSTTDLIGEQRKLSGLLDSTDGIIDSPNSRKISSRYGSATPEVRANAAEKWQRLEKEAKWQFLYATGWLAVKNSELSENNDIGALIVEDYNLFISTHFGSRKSDNKRARDRRLWSKQKKTR